MAQSVGSVRDKPGLVEVYTPLARRLSAARIVEPTLITILALLGSLLLHPITYLREHPFWFDEAWVAVGTRAPIQDLLWVSFPTPPGWALLIRLPWLGEQGMRLLPFSFTVGAVVMAYLLGRHLAGNEKPERYVVGGITALAVMLSPWVLVRQDLKQYSADAFAALLLIWLGSRVEDGWSPRHTTQLFVAALLVALISLTSMIVIGALVVALLVAAQREGQRDALRRLIRGGLVTAIAFASYTAFVLLPNLQPWLRLFWEDYFLPGNPIDVLRTVFDRYVTLMGAYPRAWLWVVPPLLVAGLVNISRRNRAVALTVPILLATMLALGALRLYPFLDQRTSHFTLVPMVALTAAGAGSAVLRYVRGSTLRTSATVAAVGLLLVVAAAPFVRSENLPQEDVRAQVLHVQDNWSPGDVVLVSRFSQFGVAYYWEGGSVELVDTPSWFLALPALDMARYVIAPDRTHPAIAAAMSTAMAKAGETGSSGRLWIIRSHVIPSEADAWESVLEGLGLSPQVIDVGPEPLLFVDIGLMARDVGGGDGEDAA